MDFILKQCGDMDTYFGYDERIINLLELHKIKYHIDDDGDICVENKSFVLNVFLDNNMEVFMELSNIVKEQNYLCFDSSESSYCYYFLKLILPFGNLEIVEFFLSMINFEKFSAYCFEMLGYRFDDNVEIVDAVLSKLSIGISDIIYLKIVSNAVKVNNINIFKYILNRKQQPLLDSKEKYLVWEENNIEFLDYLLSRNALSEIDIINGVKIIHSKDKIELVLSYVESGRLILREDTIRLLKEYINKN
jgi:hypothetical protein